MRKRQIIFSIQVTLFLLFVNLSSVSAETIILKSGEQIEGKIIERTARVIRVKVEYLSFPLTYYLDEIERVEEETPLSLQDTAPEFSLDRSEIEKYFSEVGQYFKNKKYEDALLSLKKIVELDPNNLDFHIGLGILYYYLDRFKEAISSFEKVLNLQLNHSDAYLCLGIVYDSLGRYEESKENLLKAIQYFNEEKEIDMGKLFIAEVLLKKINKK